MSCAVLRRVVFAFFLVGLCGCSVTRVTGEVASAEYLSAQGWQNPQRLLQHASFTDYATAVRREVSEHRIPFNAYSAEQEVLMASPTEYTPARHCGETSTGIAILVHGLSDTAFTMQDVSRVLADACYTSRTVLLPGHGTRSGDMLTTRLSHWNDTLTYLIDQAAKESDNILLVGFSLGAVLALHQTIVPESKVDGLIAVSPAYHLSSYRTARWARWVRVFVPWIDKGKADDAMRYEAMPTRGVVETVKAIQQLHRKMAKHGPIEVPWLLAQSADDAVVLPQENQRFWQSNAKHPDSRLVQFYSDTVPEDGVRTLNLSGTDTTQRVLGLTHVALHVSPDNEHYGIRGNYRNCGLTAPRDREWVKACEDANTVSFGLWNTVPKPGEPVAISTFNPAFKQFAHEVKTFAIKVSKFAQ